MWVYKVQSPVNDLIVGLPDDAIEQFDGASGALYIQWLRDYAFLLTA